MCFRKQILILFTYLMTFPLHADDLMIITADRIKSSPDKSSSDVKIITSEDIKKTSSHTLPELLSHESDLSVISSGPNGSNASLFLRGTDSSHTLVVIDGIIMNDPSNPNRQFDIGKLSLNNVERVEILKGSQGLLYGSNAIGGVIVITTKRAKGKELKGEQFIEYGSFDTVAAGANFQKKFNDLSLSFGADVMGTDGFSVADKKYNPNADKDGAQRVTLDLGTELDLSEAYSLDLKLRYAHNKADLDKGGGAGADSSNDKQQEEELYSKVELTKNWDAGNAVTKFSYNRSTHFRNLETFEDVQPLRGRRVVTKGEMDDFLVNHTYLINEQFSQNINLEFLHENDQSMHFTQNISGLVYHQYELPSSVFNFGLRFDQNNVFDSHYTYKLAAGYKMTDGLLKISYSTGYRAPSVNQLYDPVYGNKNLSPETSRSSDFSLEKIINSKYKTISTVFYTKISNRLSYNPNTFINLNSGNAEIIGFEQNVNVDWRKVLKQSLSFTLLRARDLTTGNKLARRPDTKIKNIFTYIIHERHYFYYELSFSGKRPDVDNNGNPVQTDSYLLSNLYYRYVMNEKSELYFKILNLFNKDYEEIYGFGTGGRAMTAGARYNF